jgi:hypothetical protein
MFRRQFFLHFTQIYDFHLGILVLSSDLALKQIHLNSDLKHTSPDFDIFSHDKNGIWNMVVRRPTGL